VVVVEEVELLLELEEVVNAVAVVVISIPASRSGPKDTFGISTCGTLIVCLKHSSQIGFVLVRKKNPPIVPQIKHLNFFSMF